MFCNPQLPQSSWNDNQECSEQMSAISILLEAGETEQAREKLGPFAQRFPDDAMAHTFASVCYSQIGDIPSAMAENAIAMALCPTDSAQYERLAGLLRQQGYRQAADQIQGKTLVVIGEKAVKRINSPLYLLVSALTGVAVSFAPLGLYVIGATAGEHYMSFSQLLNPWFLLCWATTYFVSLFYIGIASPVIAQVYRRKKATKSANEILRVSR